MRYLKVSLILGAIVSALVVIGLRAGAFAQADTALWQFTGHAGFAPAAGLWQYALVILLGCSLAWTTVDIPRPWLKVLVAGLALAEMIVAAWVAYWYQSFFSPFAPLLAGALSLAGGLIYGRSEAGRRQQLVTEVFGDRISLRTKRRLVNMPEPLILEGEARPASVVVCEIFNHDTLMDSMPVADYVAMMNRFLGDAAEFLVERGGYLDECDGESLRVIFGVPLPDDDHAKIAAQAALDLLAKVAEWNREFLEKWQHALDCRIGVNSGEMVTAAYGSRRLGGFSVAGEPVEFARRLCVANAVYGTRILLGSKTQVGASAHIEVRPMELVRGKDERYREEVYELLAPEHGLSDDALARREHFWRGIIYFRKQLWEQALENFRKALPENGQDQPVQFYIRRIEHLRAGAPLRELENASL